MREQARQGVIRVYTAVMLVAFPLLFHDRFLDIQTFKAGLFEAASVAAISAIFLLDIWRIVMRAVRHEKAGENAGITPGEAAGRRGIGIPFGMLALFCVVVLSSWRMSSWRQMAWDGSMGRRMGTAAFLLCAVMCVEIARLFKPHAFFFWGGAAANLVVCLLIILHFWGIDLLGMYADLIPEQHAFFLGTIGNRNVTAGYLSLIIPAGMALYCYCGSKRRRMFLAGSLLIGMYAGLASSSDSFLLGCLGGYLVLLWVALSDPQMLGRYAQLFLVGCAAFLCMKLSLAVGHVAGCQAPFFSAYPGDGLLGAVMRSVPVLPVGGSIGAIALLYVVRRSFQKSGDRKKQAAFLHGCLLIRRAIFGLLLLSGLVLGLLVISANRYAEGTCPQILQRFQLSFAFGSGRGYIWRRTIVAFARMPVREKLFGCGPDCFYLHMMPQYAEEMATLFGVPFADAHCEALQLLLTTGLLGVIGYFGFLLSAMVWLLSSKAVKGPYGALAGAVIVAYLGQGIANSPQVAVTPILFVILGMCAGAAVRSMGARG